MNEKTRSDLLKIQISEYIENYRAEKYTYIRRRQLKDPLLNILFRLFCAPEERI